MLLSCSCFFFFLWLISSCVPHFSVRNGTACKHSSNTPPPQSVNSIETEGSARLVLIMFICLHNAQAFQHGVDDLILLDDISNEGIFQTLKSRYGANLIYVRTEPLYSKRCCLFVASSPPPAKHLSLGSFKSHVFATNGADVHRTSAHSNESLPNASYLWPKCNQKPPGMQLRLATQEGYNTAFVHNWFPNNWTHSMMINVGALYLWRAATHLFNRRACLPLIAHWGHKSNDYYKVCLHCDYSTL